MNMQTVRTRLTQKEFDQCVSPVNNDKCLDRTACVYVSTIQRMYPMLKGRHLPEQDDEVSCSTPSPTSVGEGRGEGALSLEVPPVDCNPALPIETFDIIVTDEAHRPIDNLWRQVLE